MNICTTGTLDDRPILLAVAGHTNGSDLSHHTAPQAGDDEVQGEELDDDEALEDEDDEDDEEEGDDEEDEDDEADDDDDDEDDEEDEPDTSADGFGRRAGA